MKSCLIPAGDEEEGAALVPPLPAMLQEDGVAMAAPCKVVDVDGKADDPSVERQPSSWSTTTKRRWKTALLSPTKGAVGLVIGSLVLLVLLACTGWIDLEDVSTPLYSTSNIELDR